MRGTKTARRDRVHRLRAALAMAFPSVRSVRRCQGSAGRKVLVVVWQESRDGATWPVFDKPETLACARDFKNLQVIETVLGNRLALECPKTVNDRRVTKLLNCRPGRHEGHFRRRLKHAVRPRIIERNLLGTKCQSFHLKGWKEIEISEEHCSRKNALRLSPRSQEIVRAPAHGTDRERVPALQELLIRRPRWRRATVLTAHTGQLPTGEARTT